MTINRHSILLGAPEQEPHHQIQFSVLPQTPFFLEVRILTLYMGYSQHILSLAEGFIEDRDMYKNNNKKKKKKKYVNYTFLQKIKIFFILLTLKY